MGTRRKTNVTHVKVGGRREPAAYGYLVGGIAGVLEAARRASARAVNAVMTATYWEIGRRIVEVGDAYVRPQCSACFIQSVDDDLMSIFQLVKNEARLFKYGSGTGTNFSHIRARQEKLSGGGTSSGLMSFLEVCDKGAGATKSGDDPARCENGMPQYGSS